MNAEQLQSLAVLALAMVPVALLWRVWILDAGLSAATAPSSPLRTEQLVAVLAIEQLCR